MTAVVLVEGMSDKAAVEALARRRGRDLAAEGVSILAIGGAQAAGRALDELRGVAVAGLCDAGEEPIFRRAFARAGVVAVGVFVCEPDLEGELIRALGAAAVEDVLEANGDLGSFRTLQMQPTWRGRPPEEQLRRFMGSVARRKLRYAALLVDALDLADVPRPLDGVLAAV